MRQLADSSLLCTETNQPTNQSPKEGDNECNIFVQTSPFCLLMKWSKAFGYVWFLFSRIVLCSWKQKTCLGKGVCFVFCVFCVFRVLKNHFFENNKKIFSLFFQCSMHRLFFMFSLPSLYIFLFAFYVSTKVNSTQLPYPHPQSLSSSLNHWN